MGLVNYTRDRWPLVIIACLQSFLFSGILYGWASLYTMFLETGVFRNKCPTSEICEAQKSALTWIYTVASCVNLAAQLPWGMLLDRFGPRACFTLSSAGVMAGVYLLGQSSPDYDAYLPAVTLIGAAGPGVQISLFHVSELFPVQKSSILSAISGSFQLSFTVFLVFRLLSNYLGWTLAEMCWFYLIPLGVLLVIGVIVWPDSPCQPPLSEASPLQGVLQRHPEFATQTFREQLMSGTFAGVLLWMSVCLFWANFYVGTVVEQLYLKSGEQPAPTRVYTNIFNVLLPVGVLGIPIFGWVTDKYGFTVSIIVTSGLAILFSAANLSSSLTVQLATFLAYSFFRTFLFSLMFSYLASEFGFRNFGRLSGVLLGVAGGIGLLQYPLQTYQASGALNAVNMIQFASLSSTLLFAFYHARRVQAGLECNSPWTHHLKARRLNKNYDAFKRFRQQGAASSDDDAQIDEEIKALTEEERDTALPAAAAASRRQEMA